MTDREKVIKWLEKEIKSNDYWDEDYIDCIPVSMLKDILALLKEQEPRVLNIVELKNFAVIWFEARNHLYIEPMLTRGKNFADESTDWFRYGKEWRCWTSKPTIEQRKAVKWDES